MLLKNSAAVLPVNASCVKRILLFGALIVRSLHCSWTTLSSGVSVAHRLAARLAASWLSPPYGTAERTVTTLVVCPDAARSDRTTARTVPLRPIDRSIDRSLPRELFKRWAAACDNSASMYRETAVDEGNRLLLF